MGCDDRPVAGAAGTSFRTWTISGGYIRMTLPSPCEARGVAGNVPARMLAR